MDNKEVKKNENTNEEKKPLGEKIEDKMDDIFGSVNDFLYGENPDFNNDVPATFEKPNGFRKVNKIQTRKNLNKKILNKGVGKALIIIFSVGIIITILYKVIEKILMA